MTRIGGSILIFLLLLISATAQSEEKNLSMTDQFRISHAEVLKHQHRYKALAQRRRQPLDVIHYNLALTIDPISAQIHGSNTMTINTLSPLNKIYLDLNNNLQVIRAKFNDAEIVVHQENNIVIIDPPSKITAHQQFNIYLEYQDRKSTRL